MTSCVCAASHTPCSPSPRQGTSSSDGGCQDAGRHHTSSDMTSQRIPTAASGPSDTASRSHSMSHGQQGFAGRHPLTVDRNEVADAVNK